MKLVRDNVPDLMKKFGKDPKTHFAVGEEFEEALISKLDEELKEVKEGRNIEEIADLIEICYSLAKEYGLNEDQLNVIRKKSKKNGGFNKKIILDN